MELRCEKCYTFLIEIVYNERSGQDFVVSRVCPKCKHFNAYKLKIRKGFEPERSKI